MNTINDFGRKLRQLRKDNDLTQEGLGKELGEKGNQHFNKSTISRWENGSRKPDPETVKDLEEIFQVDNGLLLQAAGYLVEISHAQPMPPMIDPVIVKQRVEHFAELASVTKSLLINGLGDISQPGWSTNHSILGKYLIPNNNAASGYDEITKEQLISRLNNNVDYAKKNHGDWFFRYRFVPHLKSKLPEELKTKLFYEIIEEQPYQLIEVLRRLAYG